LTMDESEITEKVEGQIEEAPKKKEAKKVGMMTKEEIIAAVKGMTVVDLADLVKALQDEFGISAAPMAMAAAAPASAAAQEAAKPVEEEEKTEFTVVLKSVGEKKIEVIKAVREVTALGLKQAKDLVESAPQTVKESIAKEEVAVVKEKLEAAGATIELK
jgi:large subunit ribosomal protein L7/L12